MAGVEATSTSIALSDPATDTSESDLQTGLDELGRAQHEYLEAEEYYEGTRLEAFASIRVRRAMARTGDNFRLNFAAVPVDEVADRLEISSISADTPQASAQLQDMWTDNQLDLEAPNIHRRACEYGDGYVIVWPTDPDEDTLPPDSQRVDDTVIGQVIVVGDGDRSDPTAVAGGDNAPTAADTDSDGFINVDIFYNSPMSVRLFYDPEKPLKKKYAIKKWVITTTKQVRVDLYYPDRIERFISRAGRTHIKDIDMVPFDGDGQGAVLDNPFGEIPVFHFRTDRPYGTPEHRRFYGVQDIVHKLVVSHMSGVDYQAFPQRYALMDPDADTSEATNSDEDAFSFALDTGATSRPSDPQSQLTADPGSFWQLKNMREVGQFDEADPKTFMDPLATYLRAGAQLSKTPFHYFDPTGGTPSGESLRVAESPLVKKIGNRQLSFGATWREMLAFALKVAGFPHAKVTVNWKSPATVDDQAGWATLLAKLQAGLPPKQAFLEAGYTPDQVEEWFGDKGDNDLPYRIDLLSKIGLAMQALSAAAAAGLFDEQQILRLVTSLIGESVIGGEQVDNPTPSSLPAAATGAVPGPMRVPAMVAGAMLPRTGGDG